VSRAAGRPVFLLPPRPRLSGWLAGGASAGLLLAGAELALAAAEGAPLVPSLALAILGFEAALVALLAGALALALRAAGVRASHSLLVGSVVAPQGLVAALAPAWGWWGSGPDPTPLELARLLGAALLAGGAAAALARLGERVERSGAPLSGPLVWAGAALVLALAARAWPGPAPAELWSRAALAGALLAAPGAALAAWAWARRRGARPQRPFAHSLAGLAALAGLALAAPRAFPWLLYDEGLPALDDAAPPNILFAALSGAGSPRGGPRPAAGVASEPPSIELLAWDGVVYDELRGDAGRGAAAPVTLADGTALAVRLDALGFATASIHADPAAPLELGASQRDARPGALRGLERSAPWLPALPFLRGPAAPLLARLGLDAERRGPEEIAAEALRWLVDWRTRRAPNPFFLALDFRDPQGGPGLAGADRALGAILGELVELEVAERTLVILVQERPAPARLRVVLRPPPLWPLPAREERRVRGLAASDLAEALLRLSRARETAGPSALPGLAPGDVRHGDVG